MKNKYTKIYFGVLIIILLFYTGCTDPLSGNPEHLAKIEEGWDKFEAHFYTEALESFIDARDGLEVDYFTDSLFLAYSGLSEAYLGMGWCYLRLNEAQESMESFMASETLGVYGFGTSIGLMGAYYKLGQPDDDGNMDESMIDNAIETGDWILSTLSTTGMDTNLFIHDPNIDSDDVRILIARSYFFKGDEDSVLEWIIIIDSETDYGYLNKDDPDTRHLPGSSQLYNSFGEVLLAILEILDIGGGLI